MKWLAWIGITLAAIALVAFGLLPRLISSDAVRLAITDRAFAITGRQLTFSGDPVIKFRPYLGIEINNAVFLPSKTDTTSGTADSATAAQPILQMPRLMGRLSLAAALTGSIELSDFQFVRPVFNLTLLEDGTTDWSFGKGRMWEALAQARTLRTETATNETPDMRRLTPVDLGTFKIVDGVIRYIQAASGREERIDSLNGTLTWANTLAPLTFSGSAIFRGQAVSGEVSATQAIMLMAGGQSDVAASLNSDSFSFVFTGQANRLSDFFVSGDISFKSVSIWRMASLFGSEPLSGAALENLQATGKLSGTLASVDLEQANILLDGNTFTGNLRLALQETEKNKLSGTLAANELDVEPYRQLVASLTGQDALVRLLSLSDVDVRMSARTVELLPATLSDVAGSIITREGEVLVDIGSANMNDGVLAGSLSASTAEQPMRLTMALDASNVDLSRIQGATQALGFTPQGPANLRLRLSAPYGDGGASMGDLDGRMTLTMRQGAIVGLDLSEIRRALGDPENGGNGVAIATPLSATPVSDLTIEALFSDGIGWVQRANFKVEQQNANLSGKVDLKGGSVAMWGSVRERAESGEEAVTAPFFIGGTIQTPLLVPQFPAPDPTPQPQDELQNNTDTPSEAIQ